MTFDIRLFKTSDTDQIAHLFHHTIRTVNALDYTDEQVKAWAPDDIYFRDWEADCLSKFTLVAEKDNCIIGFAQLKDDGHIDCFYCHAEFQNKGVGRGIYQAIESEACRRNLKTLILEASITSKSFFQKMGFSIIEKQTVNTRGVTLVNYRMKKVI